MARKDISFTPAELDAFLEEETTLAVTTLGADGTAHTVPMWYFVDDGRVVFRSFTKSQKIINLRRDPRVPVLVERGVAYTELQGVMIQGTARLIDGTDDPAYLLESYRRLAARHPMVGPDPVNLDPEALEAAFGRFAPKNTAVIVEPGRVVSWDHTKLGRGVLGPGFARPAIGNWQLARRARPCERVPSCRSPDADCSSPLAGRRSLVAGRSPPRRPGRMGSRNLPTPSY